MSLVVEPTHAYTSSQLKLNDPKRWSRLFPLIRPAVKVIDIGDNLKIVVDTTLADSKNVLVAVIASVGNFSSKILNESHIAAFATEPFGSQSISAKEVVTALKDHGFPTDNGTVVLRASTKQDFSVSSGLVEVSVIGELKLDHILSLLAVIEVEVK
jgi:dihydroxyacetone kinase